MRLFPGSLLFLFLQMVLSNTVNGQIDVAVEGSTELTIGISLEVDEVDDPANHQCCVDAPPANMDLTLGNGDLVFDIGKNEDVVSWLPITALLVGDEAFQGENETDVAGRSDIVNTISGMVFDDRLEVEITLGKDGGLLGVPITYYLTMTPEGGIWPWDMEPQPTVGFTVNGATTNNLAIGAGNAINIELTPDVPEMSGAIDTFLIVRYKFEGSTLLFYFNGIVNKWRSFEGSGYNEVRAVDTVDATNQVPFSLDFTDGLPVGAYTIFYGYDTTSDGMLTLGNLNYAKTTFTVE